MKGSDISNKVRSRISVMVWYGTYAADSIIEDFIYLTSEIRSYYSINSPKFISSKKMGTKQSTKEPEPEEVEVSRPSSQRKLSLLVLHKEPERPEMKHFCRVLNSKTNISIKLPPQLNQPSNSDNENDFMFSEVPDGKDKDAIVEWVKKQIEKKHLTLLCLLTKCNIKSLREGTGLEKDKRIIPFCFERPEVDPEDEVICIKVDFKSDKFVAKLNEKDTLNKLLAAILNENIRF